MKRRKFLALTAALVLAATTGLASCGNNSGSKGDTKELNMILYPDYVPQSVIDSFEKETGIKCNIDYVDNDTLIYTKWSEDPKGYDIFIAYFLKHICIDKCVQSRNSRLTNIITLGIF